MLFKRCLDFLLTFTLAIGPVTAQVSRSHDPFDDSVSADKPHLGIESEQPSRPSSGFIPAFKWNPNFEIDEYSLGPGDTLNVHLWGAKDLSTKVYVSPSYELFIPGVGAIKVKGLKLKDLKKEVIKSVKKRLGGNTLVAVSLNEPREFQVKISGAVPSNGERSATLMTRLSEFFAKMGGLPANASLIRIEIRNDSTKKTKIVNYQEFILKGDDSGNPFLMDGDSIFVPFKKNEVTIKGNINHPGNFQFEEDISLQKVIEEELGGFANSNRTEGQVSITRLTDDGPQTNFYDQQDFFDQNQSINYFDFVLKNGDQIYFPNPPIHNPAQGDFVYLTGQVQVPGPQKFKIGAPYSTYISAAGGVTSRANFDGIMIYKASGAKIDIKQNPSIDPGDTIFVPEVTFKFWQDHLAILTTFLAVVTTTIAISR